MQARRDPDPQVCSEAERVLLAHPQAELLDVYLAIVDRRENEETGAQARSLSVARTLLALGQGKVTEAFRTRLKHPSLGQRILAGRVLQLLGEDLGPYLDRLVGDALDAWGFRHRPGSGRGRRPGAVVGSRGRAHRPGTTGPGQGRIHAGRRVAMDRGHPR